MGIGNPPILNIFFLATDDRGKVAFHYVDVTVIDVVKYLLLCV